MEEKKHRLLARREPAVTDGADDTGESAPRGASSPRRRPLTRFSIAWRIGVTAIALIVLTCGQFLNTNDFFPLGSLTQYATAKDLDGTVNSTCISARFPGEDEPRRLAFNTATVGVERGDIESQIDRVVSHPELLQTLADSYIRLHPDEPEPEEMILCRTTTQLENGRSVGDPTLTQLAKWEVR